MNLPGPFAKDNSLINVVIETPRGSCNKYVYVPQHDYFVLKKILPFGTAFPFDFGFVPGTLGEDGQPIDVLVLSEFPFFPGCVIQCRCLGVIKAEQTEKRKKYRNDRLISVPDESLTYSKFNSIDDVNQHVLDEVIRFFEYYNEIRNIKFKFLGKGNKSVAIKLITNSLRVTA